MIGSVDNFPVDKRKVGECVRVPCMQDNDCPATTLCNKDEDSGYCSIFTCDENYDCTEGQVLLNNFIILKLVPISSPIPKVSICFTFAEYYRFALKQNAWCRVSVVLIWIATRIIYAKTPFAPLPVVKPRLTAPNDRNVTKNIHSVEVIII